MYRQFAGFGFEHMTFSADDIAQVPVFEVLVNIGANLFTLDIHLHTACAVLQRGETGFAHHPLQYHATRDAHRVFLCQQSLRSLTPMGGVQGCRVVRGFEVIGKCHRAAKGLASAHGAQFLTAFGDELVFVWEFRGGCVF
jgi:hypothetical protein